MRILIVEDENFAAERLSLLIREIIPNAEIIGPIDSIEGSVNHLKADANYDLLFLDIQLADGKSFSIFDKIHITIPVIFTTAYDEYAIKAFEVSSIDYLLKPVNKEKLIVALKKYEQFKTHFSEKSGSFDYNKLANLIRSEGNHAYKSRFLVNRGDSLIPVTSDEIAFFYAEEKVVFMVTKENKNYLIGNTLDELEEKLNPKHFFRVNRQYIVSIDVIKRIHNYFNYKLKLEIIPNPKTEVIVSKSRVTDFKTWMNTEG